MPGSPPHRPGPDFSARQRDQPHVGYGKQGTRRVDRATTIGVCRSPTARRARSRAPSCSRTNLARYLAVTAALLLLIAMGELNRLSAAVLDDKGRAWPFSQLMGPSRLLDHSADGWVAGTGTFTGGLSTWLYWYLALDVAFVLVYTATLLVLFIDRYPPAALLAVLLGAVDLTEDVLAALAGRPAVAQPEPGLVQRALPWVSGTKWLLAVLLVVGLARRFGSHSDPDWRKAFGRLVRALYTQRFSVLPILPILVLSIVPGANMLDQLPDIQRRWADGGLGVAHGLAATLSLVVLAAVVFIMGRLRTDFAWRRVYGWGERAGVHPGHAAQDVESGRPEPIVWIWVVAPVVVLLTAVILPAVTHTAGLSAVRLTFFAGIPFVVGVVSLALKRALAGPANGVVSTAVHRWVTRPAKHVLEPEHLRPIQLTGDILATMALAIGGLGLVRSFTAVVVLHPENPRAWALLAAGAGAALLVWPLADGVMRVPIDSLSPALRRVAALLVPGRADPTKPFVVSLRVALMTVCALGYLTVGSIPLVMAHWAGVIASVVLALTFMTAMVGSMVVLLQYGGSPQAFWLPRPSAVRRARREPAVRGPHRRERGRRRLRRPWRARAHRGHRVFDGHRVFEHRVFERRLVGCGGEHAPGRRREGVPRLARRPCRVPGAHPG